MREKLLLDFIMKTYIAHIRLQEYCAGGVVAMAHEQLRESCSGF